MTADPDWSNPTRSRAERPLDTIRSFEAAIYGTYTSNRPISYARTGSSTTTPYQPTIAISSQHQANNPSRRCGVTNGGFQSSNKLSWRWVIPKEPLCALHSGKTDTSKKDKVDTVEHPIQIIIILATNRIQIVLPTATTTITTITRKTTTPTNNSKMDVDAMDLVRQWIKTVTPTRTTATSVPTTMSQQCQALDPVTQTHTVNRQIQVP